MNTKIPNKALTKEDITKLRAILESLEVEPKAYDFLEPVDYEALGLTDYPAIIKNPMDLSTVKKNLKNGKYTTVQEVLGDIQLIWDNCRLYNIDGSEIYKMANHCEKVTKKLIDKHFKSLSSTTKTSSATEKSVKAETQEKQMSIPAEIKEDKEDKIEEDNDDDNNEGNEVLSLQEKLQFTERVRKLTNDGLASLVRLVEKECKNAIEDLDSEKLQIRIDQLDRKTFEQINQLIDTFLKVRETNLDNLGKKLKA